MCGALSRAYMVLRPSWYFTTPDNVFSTRFAPKTGGKCSSKGRLSRNVSFKKKAEESSRPLPCRIRLIFLCTKEDETDFVGEQRRLRTFSLSSSQQKIINKTEVKCALFTIRLQENMQQTLAGFNFHSLITSVQTVSFIIPLESKSIHLLV